MIKNTVSQHVERKKLDGFYIEALSIGKHKNNPELNEDGFVATSHTFAVIDGSAPRTPVKFLGSSSAQFATNVLKKVLATTPPSLNGSELVTVITGRLNEDVDKVGARDTITQTPEARPAALFTVARIHNGKLVITALGDIHCRVNGQMVHTDRIITEDLMIEKRIAAMNKAALQNQTFSDDEFRTLGRAAIDEDLKTQVRSYFNNPDDPLGLGIIDGEDVSKKFIRTYQFDLPDVQTLEIFSDGYYVIPEEPSIDAFEQAFSEAEREDPLRWKKYPAVKASTPDQFSDDRTILIAKAI